MIKENCAEIGWLVFSGLGVFTFTVESPGASYTKISLSTQNL